MRIRCHCGRIRVLFRDGLCRRCWKAARPMYRVVRMPNGSTRRISSAKIAQQLGRARGAAAIHANGTAHRWTSETARAAAMRAWKHAPVNKRIGVRLARPTKYRPRVMRKPLRQKHAVSALPIEPGVKFFRPTKIWLLTTVVEGVLTWRVLGERAALIRLGHLPNPSGFVPTVIDPYPVGNTGTAVATIRRKERLL